MNGLLEQLLEGSPFGIVVVDTKGILKILNPCARRLVTTIGNPIDKLFTEAIPIFDLHQMLPTNEDKQVLNTEFSYGNSVLKATSTVLKNVETDEVEGRLIILEDITQAKRLERSQREFVANVSHELRTPTTSIAGFAQMMIDDQGALSEEHQMMIQAIHRNAIRLNNLFEDLLTFRQK